MTTKVTLTLCHNLLSRSKLEINTQCIEFDYNVHVHVQLQVHTYMFDNSLIPRHTYIQWSRYAHPYFHFRL